MSSLPAPTSVAEPTKSVETVTTSLPSTQVLLYSLLKPDQELSLDALTNPVKENPSLLLNSVESVQAHCNSALVHLTVPQQFETLSKLFSSLLQKNNSCVVPSDFLELASKGMIHLQKCNRSNVIYLLSQALGTMRSDSLDSLLPSKRMPMGLIEYAVNFFTADHINQVCKYTIYYCILLHLGQMSS